MSPSIGVQQCISPFLISRAVGAQGVGCGGDDNNGDGSDDYAGDDGDDYENGGDDDDKAAGRCETFYMFQTLFELCRGRNLDHPVDIFIGLVLENTIPRNWIGLAIQTNMNREQACHIRMRLVLLAIQRGMGRRERRQERGCCCCG
jgi:hypothetical protein